ncbi:MAG: S9 family peptidase [Bacteroidales bacterium]|nr:S9 family peptidase [Bacteroidales bacterium]
MLFRSERGTKGTALAVLKGYKPDTLAQRINKLVVVTALNGRPQKRIFNAEDLAGFPGGDVISESGSIRFSLDNQRIVLSIKKQSKVIKASKDTIANVDVWHWNDEEIQSVQMVRISREKRKTYTGILHLNDSRFVQLSSDNLRYVSLNRNLNRAVGADPKPYINDINWGGGFSDYYLVNARTGEKTLIEKKIGRSMGLSPDGSYFLFFKDKNFHLYDLDTRKMTNLTAGMDVSFFNQEEDHPYENPSYGLAGWTDDRQSVILNHKYDLWIVSVDGSGGYNLTGKYGSAKEIRFRLIRLTDEPYIHLEKDIYLSAYGEWTKKSGYFLLRKGKEPKQLVFADASFGRLRKAREAGRFLFTRQTFVDFPDYYTSDLKFKKIVRQTDANPQQAEYKWGRRILIDFKNSRGDKLAATLTLPADYQPGKKYPMLVYFYEKMSQRHHSYSMPTYDDRPHMSTYASDGYLVLMPDIKYYVGQPGWCAVDCITSAVKKVIDLGYADPARIGLQGHSWGGYQSSFILTQTDMFACVVTGAPVTNLTSMYDILYKNSGTNNHGIFERGQVRMGKGMFEDMDNYIAQSPVQQASHITTPFMILQGTKDGAVDWNQGLELYNAARRLGKKVILLSYPGENHHLANRNNQKDFQLRMKQFSDHYLKGTTAPDWMVKGVKFVDKPYENAK